MPASFPTSIKTFTTKVDNTDIVYGAHVNELQDEIVALQQTLGTAPQGNAATVKARIADLETGKADAAHNHDHNTLTNLTTGDPHTQYLLKSVGTTKGDLLVHNGTSWVRVGVGANGAGLVADSTQAAGVRWSASGAIQGSTFTTKGDLLVGTGNGTYSRLGVGANGRIPVADSAQATGIAWSASAPFLLGDYTAKGQLPVGTGAGAKAQVAVGANRTMLMGDSAETAGVRWGSNPKLAGYSEAQASNATATGAVTLDLAAANVHLLTLTGNVTLAFTGAVAGETFSCTIIAIQDATGGRTLAFPAGTRFSNGTAPSPDTGANKHNIYTYITTDGGASGYAFLSGRAMA